MWRIANSPAWLKDGMGGGDGEEREREEERLLGIEYTFENASWENLA